MAPLDPAMLGEARSSRDRMLEAQHELERARADYGHAIRRLHAEGGSLREIAESLGLSHQRVHQIVEGEGRRARKGQRRGFDWPFTRFTRRARQVIVLAQEEAVSLGHSRVGTEHLLLGLALAEDESTAPALAEAGLTADAIRERVAKLETSGSTRRRRSFTRAAKRVLERSVREAHTLGDRYIGAEHILLGLLDDERAGAGAIVRDLGADPEALRAKVRERPAEA
jgi:hypothetical protein